MIRIRGCLGLICAGLWAALGLMVFAAAVPEVIPLNRATLWGLVEFRIENVPAVTNPFDPDLIRVDGRFTLPTGKVIDVPCFWYQAYHRTINRGSESLAPSGATEWRLRFTPPQTGNYALRVIVQTNGLSSTMSPAFYFSVTNTVAEPGTGFVQIAPSRQYFEISDGSALRLVGENVCWPGVRGTYDYDDWFGAMQDAGENYARLWMCPWAFGLETDKDSLTRYNLNAAWRLDYVFQLAEQRGIYLLLCLDYHGMFELSPDYWGGNNYWTNNPYYSGTGGPCATQNEFFTSVMAQSIYQKRLRYLVARYGYSRHLLAWQFFNEIDNVYGYLKPGDVATWHGLMCAWLHTHDPYGHLVTTSLTGSSDRPELWSLAQLDFAAYHSYGEPGPASRLSQVAQSFLQRYRKPVLIDEFGTDWRGWNRTNDIFLRGFRQGLWGGALGGSAGTAIPWFWEHIHDENGYPAFAALGTVLKRTGWGRGSWTNIQFLTTGMPPATVGDLVPGGSPFDVYLNLSSEWGGRPSGQLAVTDANGATYSAAMLNSFVHGSSHADLRVPFRLSAWLTNNARLVMHLNSVSGGAILSVRVDGVESYRTNLPNRDGGWQVNNEYNLDLPVGLPAGKHRIEIANPGQDWFYLDWVRLERALPAEYTGHWLPSPEAIGIRGTHESLLYVVAPGVAFPANATNAALPWQHDQSVSLASWAAGAFVAEWYDPSSGALRATTFGTTTNDTLRLVLPDFTEDLAGIVFPQPKVKTGDGNLMNDKFQFQLESETGGRYEIEHSTNLNRWLAVRIVTNIDAVMTVTFPWTRTNSPGFYRARRGN
jgi:hypothetical protein